MIDTETGSILADGAITLYWRGRKIGGKRAYEHSPNYFVDKKRSHEVLMRQILQDAGLPDNKGIPRLAPGDYDKFLEAASKYDLGVVTIGNPEDETNTD